MKEKTKRIILGIVIGGVISSGIGVSALLSSEVKYQKHNQETVKDALDDLHAKVNALVEYPRYLDGEIVYYNPLTDRGCSESDYNSSTNSNAWYVGDATNDTTKAGSCMRWFAYQDSNNSDTVHLLLDHNTTAQQAFNSSNNNNNFYQSVIYTEYLPYLINYRKWNVELEVDPSDTTKSQTVGATVLTLLDANDVAKIINYKDIRNSDWDPTNTNNYFYFETGTTSRKVYTSSSYYSPYWWLYDRTGDGGSYPCTSYGCKTADSSTYGYWTKTNSSGSYVWLVSYGGSLSGDAVGDYYYGVRPVVIVQKSKLS